MQKHAERTDKRPPIGHTLGKKWSNCQARDKIETDRYWVCRSQSSGSRSPLLAEGESGQCGEHARLPQRHSPANPGAERRPGDHSAAAGAEPASSAQHA